MNRFIAIAFALQMALCTVGYSQNDSDREKLNQLIKQRQEQFGSYAESVEKRSGIFGNKTKRDIAKSNEILTQIVTLDNSIMSLLNRKLNFKTFETTSFNFDKRDYETRLQSIMQANEKLEKRLASCESQTKAHTLKLKWVRLLNYTLAAGLLYALYHYYKTRR